MTSRFHTVLLCPTSTHPVWMRAQCRWEDIVQGRPYWKSAPGRSTIGRDDRRRPTSDTSGGIMHESEAQRDLLAAVAGLEPRDRRTRRAVTAITTLGVAALAILLCRGCGGSNSDAQEPETVAFVEAGTADALTGPAGPAGPAGPGTPGSPLGPLGPGVAEAPPPSPINSTILSRVL